VPVLSKRPGEWRGFTRRRFLKFSSIGAAATLGLGVSVLAEASGLPGLRSVALELPDLPPEWDGLVIAQVSDVHAGRYMPAERIRQVHNLVMKTPVDLVVFTGDQLDRRPSDAEAFVAGFSGISAPLGVYGILGNHDHYVPDSLAVNALLRAGITPLVNDSRVFRRHGSDLALVGVEDLHGSGERRPEFSVLRQHPGAFRICLCHQPQGWHDALTAGAHLTLAGHTHGGQIALPSRNLNLARLHSRYIAGAYRREDSLLWVSRGIGVGAMPLRVGSPPEIDLITLRRPTARASVAA
jgi:uncharacterized protein